MEHRRIRALIVNASFFPIDWVYCIDNAFTVSGGYGGCGSDDLYTRCNGKTMSGIDGDEIIWYVFWASSWAVTLMDILRRR